MNTYNVKSDLKMTDKFTQDQLESAFQQHGRVNHYANNGSMSYTAADWVANYDEGTIWIENDSGILNIDQLVEDMMVVATLGVIGSIEVIDDHCKCWRWVISYGVIVSFEGKVMYELVKIINTRGV